MSSSLLISQGVALATALAVSGTFILLASRLQKPFLATQFNLHETSPQKMKVLRPCLSSGGKRKEKSKKKVHFADDLVDPIGYSEEFKKQHGLIISSNSSSSSPPPPSSKFKKKGGQGIPANRLALYNGILRDRVHHGLTYSH